MKMRKITSLTALTSFFLLVVTSVVLYIVPAGRVAYWADWRLWGMTKTTWGNVHINLGVLFLASILLHTYYNWPAITGYLKDRARRMRVFTPEFSTALAVTAVVTVGTLLLVPPFSWIIDAGEAIKDAGAVKYGEPPYGHAELSGLKTFATRVGIDPAAALERLRAAGIRVADEKGTLQDIAADNGLTPQQVYLAMRPPENGAKTSASGALPEAPPAGFGRRTLADICQEYDLNLPAVVRRLADAGIRAAAEKSLRDIAADNGRSPQDLYQVIRQAAMVTAS